VVVYGRSGPSGCGEPCRCRAAAPIEDIRLFKNPTKLNLEVSDENREASYGSALDDGR
jgi:hypothetical protein